MIGNKQIEFDDGVNIGDIVTGSTAGSVLFINSSLQLEEDNPDFIWNSSTNTLTAENLLLDTIASKSGTTVTVNLGTDAGDDFIVGNNNTLVVEGDNERVRIGTGTSSGKLEVIDSAFPVIQAVRTSALTDTILGTIGVKHLTTGDMVDGFGAAFSFFAEDSSSVNNNFGAIGAARDGADNTSKFVFITRQSGVNNNAVTIKNDAKMGINEEDPDAMVHVVPSSTTTKGIFIKTPASYATNPLRIENSIGTLLYNVAIDGGFYTLGRIQITQTDGNENIQSVTDGELDVRATDSLNFRISAVEQVQIIDGVLQPATTNDIDLGTTDLRYKKLWVNDIVATDTIGVGLDARVPLDVQDGDSSIGWSPHAWTDVIIESTSDSGGVLGSAMSIVARDVSSIWFSDPTSQFAGRIRYQHADDQMQLWAGGTPLVYIDDDFGVGVEDPFSRAHFRVAASGVASVVNGTVMTIENNQSSFVSFLTPNTSAAGFIFGDAQSNVAGGVIYTHTDDTMAIRVAGNQDKLKVDTDAAFPATDGGIDLGKTGTRFADGFMDTLTVTGQGGFNEDSPDSMVEIVANSTVIPTLHLKLAASGTGDFLRATDSSDTDLIRMDSLGNIIMEAATRSIQFSGTAGGGQEGITYLDSGSQVRSALTFPGSDIVAFQNRASNGVVQIRANTATAGSGGERIIAIFEDDAVTIGNGTAGVDYTLTFDGETNDGIITWKEDEDQFDIEDKLETSSGRIVNVTRITGNTTLNATHHNVFADTDGGDITVTLPAGVNGTYYRIVNTGTSGNEVSIEPDGAEDLLGENLAFAIEDQESLIIVFETTEHWN